MNKTMLFPRIASFILCLAFVLSCVSCHREPDSENNSGAGASSNTASGQNGSSADSDSDKWYVKPAPSDFKTVYKSKNFEFSYEETCFLFYYCADMLMQSSAGSFEAYGGSDLDLTKNLNDQNIMSYVSWFSYIAEYILPTQAEYWLIMLEACKNDGISLTDGEKEAIRKRAEASDPKTYGNRVSLDTLASCFEMLALADKYKSTVSSRCDVSEDAVLAELESNKNGYITVDYMCFSAPVDGWEKPDSSDSSDSFPKLNEAQADDVIKRFSECKSKDDFISVYKQVLDDYYPTFTEEEKQSLLYACTVNNISPDAEIDSESSESKWIFSDERKPYDIYISDSTKDNAYITVFMLLRTAGYNTADTANVRHILLTEETYGSDEATKAKAEEILNICNSASDKETVFCELALQYTEDSGSLFTKGLYENITEGRMVKEFNNWCFDPSRTEGDCETVKTSYGYHVILYLGKGLDATSAFATETLVNDYLDAEYGKLRELYPVECDSDALTDLSI